MVTVGLSGRTKKKMVTSLCGEGHHQNNKKEAAWEYLISLIETGGKIEIVLYLNSSKRSK